MRLRLPDPKATAVRLGLYDRVPLTLAVKTVAALHPFVPKDTGRLAASASVSSPLNGRCFIRYSTPYARYVYYNHPSMSHWLEHARSSGVLSRVSPGGDET